MIENAFGSDNDKAMFQSSQSKAPVSKSRSNNVLVDCTNSQLTHQHQRSLDFEKHRMNSQNPISKTLMAPPGFEKNIDRTILPPKSTSPTLSDALSNSSSMGRIKPSSVITKVSSSGIIKPPSKATLKTSSSIGFVKPPPERNFLSSKSSTITPPPPPPLPSTSPSNVLFPKEHPLSPEKRSDVFIALFWALVEVGGQTISDFDKLAKLALSPGVRGGSHFPGETKLGKPRWDGINNAPPTMWSAGEATYEDYRKQIEAVGGLESYITSSSLFKFRPHTAPNSEPIIKTTVSEDGKARYLYDLLVAKSLKIHNVLLDKLIHLHGPRSAWKEDIERLMLIPDRTLALAETFRHLSWKRYGNANALKVFSKELYIGNIPWDTTLEALRYHFPRASKLDLYQKEGYATVHYSTSRGPADAVRFYNAKNRLVLNGNLVTLHFRRDDLQTHFDVKAIKEKQNVREMNQLQRNDGPIAGLQQKSWNEVNKGISGTFSSQNTIPNSNHQISSDSEVTAEVLEVASRYLKMSAFPACKSILDYKTLFVKNLPSWTTSVTLRQLLSPVRYCIVFPSMFREKNLRNAIVVCASPKNAAFLIEKHHAKTELEGLKLHMEFAKTHPQLIRMREAAKLESPDITDSTASSMKQDRQPFLYAQEQQRLYPSRQQQQRTYYQSSGQNFYQQEEQQRHGHHPYSGAESPASWEAIRLAAGQHRQRHHIQHQQIPYHQQQQSYRYAQQDHQQNRFKRQQNSQHYMQMPHNRQRYNHHQPQMQHQHRQHVQAHQQPQLSQHSEQHFRFQNQQQPKFQNQKSRMSSTANVSGNGSLISTSGLKNVWSTKFSSGDATLKVNASEFVPKSTDLVAEVKKLKMNGSEFVS
eukprot:g5853.t1